MPLLSIVIPTRDRARYVGAAIATALQSEGVPLEVLVLDNASNDETPAIVRGIKDMRIRYIRSEQRLSMRANFERGLDQANGDYIGFIGDDDGVLEYTPATVHRVFDSPSVMAVAAARAHYWWPDLVASRRDTGLLPRGNREEIRNSRRELRHLLQTSDYYRLPCLYHGFVRRELVDRARRERFFLSSQVDIYSAIALSMEDVQFAYSNRPLVINGGSARSNGASHFGGGTTVESTKWKQEDDLGFLAGFEPHATVGSLIIESALRYSAAAGLKLNDIFPQQDINKVMAEERQERERRGLSTDALPLAEQAAGVEDAANAVSRRSKLGQSARAFFETMPVDMQRRGVTDVLQAAHQFQAQMNKGRMRNFERPIEQVRTALKIKRA